MKTLFTADQRQVLREATYQVDAAVRAEANKVWDSVIRHVKDQAKHDYPNLVLTRLGRDGGVFVYSHSTDLPRDVRVFLAPSGSNPYFAPYRGAGSGFVIKVNVLIDDQDLTHLDTRITAPKARKDFVHEYVHYLDQKRNPTLGRPGSQAAKAARTGDAAAYFSTPEEFNAWFQGLAHEVEDGIRGGVQAAAQVKGRGRHGDDMAQHNIDRLKQEFSSFASFLQGVEGRTMQFERMLRHIKGTKWERKWMKRLHGMYRALKPKVMKLSLDNLSLGKG